MCQLLSAKVPKNDQMGYFLGNGLTFPWWIYLPICWKRNWSMAICVHAKFWTEKNHYSRCSLISQSVLLNRTKRVQKEEVSMGIVIVEALTNWSSLHTKYNSGRNALTVNESSQVRFFAFWDQRFFKDNLINDDVNISTEEWKRERRKGERKEWSQKILLQ